MVMNLPCQVIPAEIAVVFGALVNDVIQGLHPEIARLPQTLAERALIDPAADGPNCVNERQPGQLEPRRAQVENGMLMWAAQKIERRITDQEREVRHLRRFVTGQG